MLLSDRMMACMSVKPSTREEIFLNLGIFRSDTISINIFTTTVFANELQIYR